MFRNYFVVAFRNLSKRKFYASINIGGLAIGMAICLLILQYVTFESSFDTYHERVEDMYRVNLQGFTGDELKSYDELTFFAVADAISESTPEVDQITRYHPTYGTATVSILSNPPEVFRTTDLAFVDPAFFDLFRYKPIDGDAAQALSTPGGIVLTRSAAERFFGTTDAVGREMAVYSWLDATLTVRAIVEDHSGNSHIQATAFIQLQQMLDDEESQYAGQSGWGWSNFETYIRIRADADTKLVNDKIDQSLYLGNKESWDSKNQSVKAVLQPVADIHLFTNFDASKSRSAAYTNVLFISIIGFFVLIIAWLNYVNLATSRAMERALEVGIRKASGARRIQITTQFLTESLLTNAIALVIAVGLATYATPWLNTLADTNVTPVVWRDPRLWGILVVFFGVGAFLASIYPSIVVSRFQPATILKGLNGGSRGNSRLRQGLVVFQFAMSMTLLSGSWIVYKQVDHLRGVDPGFSTDQVLVVERPGVIDDVQEYVAQRTSFFEQVRSLASVAMVANSTMVPGSGYNMNTNARPESAPNTDEFAVHAFWIGNRFLETYDMTLLAGREMDMESEYDRESGMLVNRTAMRAFGYDRPEDAIGEKVIVGDNTSAEIVGVLGDFNWMSAKETASPVLIFPARGGSYYSIKVEGGKLSETVLTVKALFDESFPGNSYEYFFADDRFNELYKSEERLMSLVTVFAGFALLVAALGLLGLAALTAAHRRKEISVRKVLGAGHMTVARLLTGHFVVLAGIAAIVAFPIVWIVGDRWLDNFASRMSMTPDIFILPAVIVLLVSLIASGFHVWRLATANPIDGIRMS